MDTHRTTARSLDASRAGDTRHVVNADGHGRVFLRSTAEPRTGSRRVAARVLRAVPIVGEVTIALPEAAGAAPTAG